MEKSASLDFDARVEHRAKNIEGTRLNSALKFYDTEARNYLRPGREHTATFIGTTMATHVFHQWARAHNTHTRTQGPFLFLYAHRDDDLDSKQRYYRTYQIYVELQSDLRKGIHSRYLA